jgi:membrane protease YdiL (CAAX protease family)
MSSLPQNKSSTSDAHAFVQKIPPECRQRDLLELAVGYGLILLALWTPLPWQRWFDWVALAWVLIVSALSFDGLTANGLRERGFLRSLWVVGAALALAAGAIALSARLHTLRAPRYPAFFIHRYWAYAVWAFLQEFLLLDFFLRRLLRLLRSRTVAVAVTAALFALAHLPNPILMPVTLVWGAIACALFLRYRNLYTLGLAHAIFGICIAVTVPAQADHNMRVGLGYLTYRPQSHRHHHRNQSPQTVSTTAWVMDEAPTRRS